MCKVRIFSVLNEIYIRLKNSQDQLSGCKKQNCLKEQNRQLQFVVEIKYLVRIN